MTKRFEAEKTELSGSNAGPDLEDQHDLPVQVVNSEPDTQIQGHVSSNPSAQFTSLVMETNPSDIIYTRDV